MIFNKHDSNGGEAIVVYFKVLYWLSLEGIKKAHNKHHFMKRSMFLI
jgi:hypothetical protein